MYSNKSKIVAICIAIGAFAIGAYWYWSPYLAMRQLQAAAQSKDADAFNERVDYPKLRESIKGQFSAMMAEKLGNASKSEGGFAALGTLLGAAMVSQAVEALVRPEAVMQAMRSGKFGGKPAADAPTSSPSGDPGASPTSAVKMEFERKSVNKLIAYAMDVTKPAETNDERMGLVFERSGFADWKLTEIRLPTGIM